MVVGYQVTGVDWNWLDSGLLINKGISMLKPPEGGDNAFRHYVRAVH